MTRHPWPGLKWNDQISSIKAWQCDKDKAPVFPYKGAFCKTTSVRYTTGDEKGANSHMRPKIALMGTKGAAVGVLKHLPLKGGTKMTVIKTDNIGEIQSLRLLATSPDAWYFTDFAVKPCQPGSKWIPFGCTHLWLDGRKISKKEAERRSPPVTRSMRTGSPSTAIVMAPVRSWSLRLPSRSPQVSRIMQSRR